MANEQDKPKAAPVELSKTQAMSPSEASNILRSSTKSFQGFMVAADRMQEVLNVAGGMEEKKKELENDLKKLGDELAKQKEGFSKQIKDQQEQQDKLLKDHQKSYNEQLGQFEKDKAAIQEQAAELKKSMEQADVDFKKMADDRTAMIKKLDKDIEQKGAQLQDLERRLEAIRKVVQTP